MILMQWPVRKRLPRGWMLADQAINRHMLYCVLITPKPKRRRR